MWKRSDQLLKEYPRTNKTATGVLNNIRIPKPEPLEMARFSERERREIRNCFNCFWFVCFIGLPNSSLYSYGRPGFPPLRWPPWPSSLNYKARPTEIIYTISLELLISACHENSSLVISMCPQCLVYHYDICNSPKTHDSLFIL